MKMSKHTSVCARVSELRASARASGLEAHVHTHVSCPCTVGSPAQAKSLQTFRPNHHSCEAQGQAVQSFAETGTSICQ